MTRVLIVEDFGALRRAYVRSLRECYSVRAVETVAEAFDSIDEDGLPDAILVDQGLNTSAMSGDAFLAHCVGRWPDLRERSALLTGSLKHKAFADALGVGFVLKPVTTEVLREVVAGLVAQD